MLDLGGHETEVVEWGDAGPAVILIHGANMSPHMFDDFAPRFADRYHLVAFARRGHGKATPPSESFDIDDLANDIAVVMDSLGIEQAVLMAHSFGGNEITRFVAVHPDRVTGLVYLDADFGGADQGVLELLAAGPVPPCAEHSGDSFASLRRCIADYLMAPHAWNASLEELIRDIADTTGPVTFKTEAEHVGTSMEAVNSNYHRDYGAIQVPVLFLVSDTYFSVQTADTAWNRSFQAWNDTSGYAEAKFANVERLRRLFPEGRVVVVPGTSHDNFVLFDQVAQEVGAFLRDLPVRRRRRG